MIRIFDGGKFSSHRFFFGGGFSCRTGKYPLTFFYDFWYNNKKKFILTFEWINGNKNKKYTFASHIKVMVI